MRSGISLLPRNVLTTFPDAKLLSVHALPPGLDRAATVLIWRKGTLSPKIRALLDILLAHSDLQQAPRAAGRNGRGSRARSNGRAGP